MWELKDTINPYERVIFLRRTFYSQVIFILQDTAPEKHLQRQLELAERYLSEEKYEQAIVIFERIIEIDDKCVEAYLGNAKAYMEIDNDEKAWEILNKGYERTQDKRIEEQLLEIRCVAIQPLHAKDLSWIIEPIYEFQDVEPIYGEAFSDIGGRRILGWDGKLF